MPSFSVEIEHELEFEAYCGECSEGMCLNVDTNKTHGRNQDYIKIEPCKKCIQNAEEKGREKAEAEYQSRIDDLEAELESLKQEFADV
jgi:hypothetical protein